jgi:hypothetical protein
MFRPFCHNEARRRRRSASRFAAIFLRAIECLHRPGGIFYGSSARPPWIRSKFIGSPWILALPSPPAPCFQRAGNSAISCVSTTATRGRRPWTEPFSGSERSCGVIDSGGSRTAAPILRVASRLRRSRGPMWAGAQRIVWDYPIVLAPAPNGRCSCAVRILPPARAKG